MCEINSDRVACVALSYEWLNIGDPLALCLLKLEAGNLGPSGLQPVWLTSRWVAARPTDTIRRLLLTCKRVFAGQILFYIGIVDAFNCAAT